MYSYVTTMPNFSHNMVRYNCMEPCLRNWTYSSNYHVVQILTNEKIPDWIKADVVRIATCLQPYTGNMTRQLYKEHYININLWARRRQELFI